MAEKTQEEFDALLAQVEELKGKVAELSTASVESQIDAKVAAATAELESKVTDLQTQLDASVLEAQAAKDEKESTLAFLAGVEAEATAAAELAQRKETRITQVKEVASFPDEYLEANADRFAAMSDEAFAAALEDWKTVAPKKSETANGKKEEVPSVTAMTASRTTTETVNPLREVMDLRFQGVDVRTV